MGHTLKNWSSFKRKNPYAWYSTQTTCFGVRSIIRVFRFFKRVPHAGASSRSEPLWPPCAIWLAYSHSSHKQRASNSRVTNTILNNLCSINRKRANESVIDTPTTSACCWSLPETRYAPKFERSLRSKSSYDQHFDIVWLCCRFTPRQGQRLSFKLNRAYTRSLKRVAGYK